MLLTIQQAQAYAAQAGFTNASVPGTNATQIQTITAIMIAENGLNIPGKTPQDTFNNAYTSFALSGGFNGFSSFTSGTFKNNLSTASIGTIGIPATISTPVTDIFAKNSLEQWWNEPHDNFFGQSGELGQDYGMRGGFNTPVGAIMGGKVVAILTNGKSPFGPGPDAVGYVVQIMTPSDGLHHYQHLRTAHVSKGDTINAGDTVGSSGGCAEGNYGSGGSCIHYNQYSEGNHIEVRWAPSAKGPGWTQHWVDPKDHFIALSKLSALTSPFGSINGLPTNGNEGPLQGIQTFAKNLPGIVQLAPDANVASFLEAIDLNLSIRNPFDIGSFDETIGTWSILGTTIDNPIQWFGDVAWNLMLDMGLIGIRGTIVVTGIFICWKVLGSTILGQAGSTVAEGGATIAAIGA